MVKKVEEARITTQRRQTHAHSNSGAVGIWSTAHWYIFMNQLLNRLFARSTFNSAEELDQFAVEVIQKLRRAELHDAAKILEDWRAPAYTTGSEWLGELGLAIRKIQKQYKIDKDINADLNRLLRQVYKV